MLYNNQNKPKLFKDAFMPEIKCKSMTMEECKEKARKLVKQFSANENYFKSKDFVESETRNKFIDPFLE